MPSGRSCHRVSQIYDRQYNPVAVTLPDHGSMHWDLVGLFGCSDCKAAGRDRRPVVTTQVSRRKRNRDWKPTFD